MSLVEKALRKLQTTRGAPDMQRSNAPMREAGVAVEERTPPIAPSQPAVRDAEPAFDPHNFTTRIARIDRERLSGLRMLPPKSQEREIGTQFRAIKRPLIRFAQEAAQTNEPLRRTLMVASALPGDGKTFTSVNLALSLALELDMRVLLVDADTPKRHLSQTLDLDSEKGLLDVLRDDGPQLEQVILPTDVPRLDVLPVGTRTETATELVASLKMRDTVNRLAALYRRGIVVFDSPPVLLTNESRSLAPLLGQIVLVVRAGVTPQRAVEDAVGMLGEGLRISLVLNGTDLAGGVADYYYGNRYGYGYGESSAPAAHSPANEE